jgi:Ca2+/H+ antiporter
MLQMSLKMLTLTFIVGTCALLGFVMYALLDNNKVAGLTTAWLMLAGMVCALIPPLAIAFQKFDVARDTPP